MFVFFKQWAANATEYRDLQKELTAVMAGHGINFMHLHPEMTKFLVGMAREEGAEMAVARLNEAMEVYAKMNGYCHYAYLISERHKSAESAH